MPVQINELIIRANISEGGEKPAGSETSSPAASADKEEIIKECTQIILEILENQKQR